MIPGRYFGKHNKNDFDNPIFLEKLVTALTKAENFHRARKSTLEIVMINKFLSCEEERSLLCNIDAGVWNCALSRRTQHYGFVYDYSSKKAAHKTTPIPNWCDYVVDRLLEMGLLDVRPDQMIINEYLQGIYPHVDNVHSFEDGIVSISLGSAVIMDFVLNSDPTKKNEVFLPPRSAICIHGAARYDWRHGIAARKSDHGVKRGRRVSLTFRKMRDSQKKPKIEDE